jgi:hypothetical protein
MHEIRKNFWHGRCSTPRANSLGPFAVTQGIYALLTKVQSERKPPYRKRYARRACERHADLAGRCLCP